MPSMPYIGVVFPFLGLLSSDRYHIFLDELKETQIFLSPINMILQCCTVVGRTAVGRTAVGRTAVGRTAVGRTEVGRTDEGRTADGRTEERR